MGSDDWTTPQPFFDRLNQIYRFNWDLAASEDNHLCVNYCTKEQDALSREWDGIKGWLNPPYSQLGTHPWAHKAYLAAKYQQSTVVMLIPANRTEQAFWHDWCLKATRIIYVRGRIKFGDPERMSYQWWYDKIMKPCLYSVGTGCCEHGTRNGREACMYKSCPVREQKQRDEWLKMMTLCGHRGLSACHHEKGKGSCLQDQCPIVPKPRTSPRDPSVVVVFQRNMVNLETGPHLSSMDAYNE